MARREARIEQTRWEVTRCGEALRAWADGRRGSGDSDRYLSQLDAIERVAEGNLARMGAELDAAAAGLPVGEVYERCGRVDRHLVWLSRLWSYFREKWDQRDDSELSPVLAAADEIVWSSYAPAFRRLSLPVGPPPLPHIEPATSPRAVSRRRPPGSLGPADALLDSAVGRMPVSTIGLPETCVSSPWWLILLPHEVGHQVAYELDGGALPASIADLVGAAAAQAVPGAGDEWRRWVHELFADAFACALVGFAHLWAIAELECGDDEALTRRRGAYPPRLVRGAFAAELLRRLGISRDEALPPARSVPDLDALAIDEVERERLRELLMATPGVAAALASEPLAGGSRLGELTALDPERLGRSGRAGVWWRAMAGPAGPGAEPALEAPRLAAVGALAEWADTTAEPDVERRRERAERLRERMLRTIPGCREPGVRAAAPPSRSALSELAREIAEEAAAVTAAEANEEWEGDATAGTPAVA